MPYLRAHTHTRTDSVWWTENQLSFYNTDFFKWEIIITIHWFTWFILLIFVIFKMFRSLCFLAFFQVSVVVSIVLHKEQYGRANKSVWSTLWLSQQVFALLYIKHCYCVSAFFCYHFLERLFLNWHNRTSLLPSFFYFTV